MRRMTVSTSEIASSKKKTPPRRETMTGETDDPLP
jgi:hypothetical protein